MFVSRSDQVAVDHYPLNLGMFDNYILLLSKFFRVMDNGKRDSQIFTDWKERFEIVPEACHWDEHIKLINLVTRLCGQV